ncbi:MAG: xylB [Microbacteriaceae bacterium]|nr:xylB [Microbacteriaceae bacterium]
MIIAHDLGTTGDKASLHHDDGRLIASHTAVYETDYGRGGVVEQDPHAWWAAVASATRALLAATSTEASEVRVVGLSGQMMGAVFLDEQLSLVRPAMIWADTRSSVQSDRLANAVGQDVGYATTGHQFNPTYSLSKIMWLREHDAATFSRVAHVCQAKDYVVARLTGRLATDPSDASGTNSFDQDTGTWSTAILEAAGIDVRLLPEILPSTSVVGEVTAEAAAFTGLAAGTPVVIGGGDGPLAALGAGIVDESDGAYAYLGSSSWVSFAAPRPLLDPGKRTMTFNHVVPGGFVPTATMQSGGGSLQWIADLLEPGADGTAFDWLVGDAAAVEASGEGLFFLPHLLGERSSYWNPDARAAFVGVSRHHGAGHLTRAVLEGVAFNLSTCVDAFRQSGAVIDRVDAIGGGAKSDVWLQIMADVWGVTVRRRDIVDEANSLGAAVTAGVGAGLIADFGVARDLSSVTAFFEPDARRHEAYVAAHERFVDAYARLESWHTEGTP